jgi:hypothetical protein
MNPAKGHGVVSGSLVVHPYIIDNTKLSVTIALKNDRC